MESLFSFFLFMGFFYLMMRFGCGAHSTGGGCGHSSHHGNRHENVPDRTISDGKSTTPDPVCGMEMEISQSARSMQHGFYTFYFCSDGCYRTFKERPDYFADIAKTQNRNVA